MLALKAIGNAGLPMALPALVKVLKDDSEELVVRITAADGMRRLSAIIPRKLQTILMPIFMNNRERSALRIVTFNVIMRTLPSSEVIDQIVMGLENEQATDVYSYCFQALRVLSTSINPGFSRMRMSIRNAFKVIKVDEKMLNSSSGSAYFPLFCKTVNEGILLNIFSNFDEIELLSKHVGAYMNIMFNDETAQDTLALSCTQTGFHTLIEETKDEPSIQSFISRFPQGIYNMFGVEERFSNDSAFAAINFRIFDVDQFFIPINPGTNDITGPQNDIPICPFYSKERAVNIQYILS